MTLYTEDELADLLKIQPAKVAELRRRHRWPHLRLGRFDIRYTDDQVADIVRLHTEQIVSTSAPVVSVAGQTARSAARRRA